MRIVDCICAGCGTSYQFEQFEQKTSSSRIRQFCSRSCSKRGTFNPQWKGNKASVVSGRARARHRYPSVKCESCNQGNRRLDRHHKDGNALNNEPSNIAILCRRCHMIADGRLDVLREQATAAGAIGNAIARINTRLRLDARTHCKHGHEYTPINTRYRKTGTRICLTCQIEATRLWRERTKTI